MQEHGGRSAVSWQCQENFCDLIINCLPTPNNGLGKYQSESLKSWTLNEGKISKPQPQPVFLHSMLCRPNSAWILKLVDPSVDCLPSWRSSVHFQLKSMLSCYNWACHMNKFNHHCIFLEQKTWWKTDFCNMPFPGFFY